MTLRRLPLCADLINRNFDDYSLLDVGCRTMDLKKYLKGCREYKGTDFVSGPDIFDCNLEEGLPFPDKSFDIVVALDVLEHLENAHNTFADILRVSRKAVFISLPNIFYYAVRLRFLAGKGLGGKYDFPTGKIMDRHRWVMSYDETVEFVKNNAQGYNVFVQKIVPERGRTRLVSEPIEDYLSDKWPNAFAFGSLFMLTPKEAQSVEAA